MPTSGRASLLARPSAPPACSARIEGDAVRRRLRCRHQGVRACSRVRLRRRPHFAGAGGRLLRARIRAVPRRVLPAPTDRTVALADPGGRLRRLPVPEAVHVAEPSVARRSRRPRAGGRLGRDHGTASVGGMGSRCGGRGLDCRLRPLLLALRPRHRRAAGTAFGRVTLRRARRLRRGPPVARCDRRVARRGRLRARPRLALLDRRGRRRGAARLRTLARASERPATPRRGLLHSQRGHQRCVFAVRARGSSAVIRARALEKRYGDTRILRGGTLDVGSDDFLLVTGPNGSGKTTLLRLCAGLAAPTRGELEVGVERGRLGYLGHEPLVYRELTALENLDLYGRLYRVPDRRERTGMLLERFGLWDVRHARAGSFSRGMLQRLALCRTLLHEPSLLLLDEPYSGLDDEGEQLLDRELTERAGRASFVVATHEPERLEHFASARLALV